MALENVFFENNARNRLLMLAKIYLVGKFGVRKFGDDQEFPLGLSQISLLKKNFSKVSVSYPEFMCFRLVGSHVYEKLGGYGLALDEWIFKHLPSLNKYSYRQIIQLEK